MIAAVGVEAFCPSVYLPVRTMVSPELRGGAGRRDPVNRPANRREHQAFLATVKNRQVPMLHFVLSRTELFDRFPGISLSGDPCKPHYWQGKKLGDNTKVHVWCKKTSSSANGQKDFSDSKVIAIHPDTDEYKTTNMTGWSNARDFEVWNNNPQFLKMPATKLFFKRLGQRYRIGATAVKDKLGDSSAVANGYTGILSANWGMTSGAVALLYLLYAYDIRDKSPHHALHNSLPLRDHLIESPKQTSGQNVNQPALISQIGNTTQGIPPTTASLQG